jgi:hypothetical protein
MRGGLKKDVVGVSGAEGGAGIESRLRTLMELRATRGSDNQWKPQQEQTPLQDSGAIGAG